MTSIGRVFRSWLHCRFAMQSRGEDILILENMTPGPWLRLQSQCEELLGRPHLPLQAQELSGGWPRAQCRDASKKVAQGVQDTTSLAHLQF